MHNIWSLLNELFNKIITIKSHIVDINVVYLSVFLLPTAATARITSDTFKIACVSKCYACGNKLIAGQLVLCILLFPSLIIQLTLALNIVLLFNLATFTTLWPVSLHKVLLDLSQKGTAHIFVQRVFLNIESLIVSGYLKFTARCNCSLRADVNIGPWRVTESHYNSIYLSQQKVKKTGTVLRVPVTKPGPEPTNARDNLGGLCF